MELPIETYAGPVDPDWCPGCGDFGVLKAVKMAAGKAGVAPKDLVVISGIGCSSNLPGYVHAYGVHSLHGRAVAVATGVRLANIDLKVVITGGDGDGYGIGIGHFIHAMRRNLDLTYVVMDNQIYGLTTGQASPTTMKDMRTKSTPRGNVELPINPIALALVSGATYVARGFSGDPNHMADLIAGGIQHKGFALIDAFSPCVTYNKLNTYPWFKKRVYKLEEDRAYNSTNVRVALEKSFEWGDRIPIGLFYRDEQPTYEDSEPAFKRGPLTKQTLAPDPALFETLVEELM
ncbi:MAG: 2-oxoacid ferredoxin oxidoreductase [Acidobacteria bacterium 13_1_20CM_2_60_10]|nr:MAG: 2-oxoacid ferredoxin oxidoreductase [Acidobacteria bacterium 13_1_20CM_2_60_10]PYU05557.1 MAG: 2-oxoacid ferredoxin oxidoreductase [Acidobacteriota bacterium]